MNITQITSLVCYSISALIAFAFSFIYLTRNEFMPYHSDAVELQWKDVDKKHQTLIIALMRVSGGGWLSGAVSMLFLLAFPFKSHALWSLIALPLIGLSTALATLYAVLHVKNNTSASPPVNLVLAAIILIILGFVLSMI